VAKVGRDSAGRSATNFLKHMQKPLISVTGTATVKNQSGTVPRHAAGQLLG